MAEYKSSSIISLSVGLAEFVHKTDLWH